MTCSSPLSPSAGAAGYAAPPRVLPRTIARTDGMAGVAAQARRWYMLVRVYVPVTYALVLAGTTFLAAGWLSASAARCLATGLPSRFSARLCVRGMRDVGRAVLVTRLWGRAGLAQNLPFLLVEPIPHTRCRRLQCRVCVVGPRYAQDHLGRHHLPAHGPQQVKVLSR